MYLGERVLSLSRQDSFDVLWSGAESRVDSGGSGSSSSGKAIRNGSEAARRRPRYTPLCLNAHYRVGLRTSFFLLLVVVVVVVGAQVVAVVVGSAVGDRVVGVR